MSIDFLLVRTIIQSTLILVKTMYLVITGHTYSVAFTVQKYKTTQFFLFVNFYGYNRVSIKFNFVSNTT